MTGALNANPNIGYNIRQGPGESSEAQ